MTKPTAAVNMLRNRYIGSGEFVTVSRQALEEVLAYLDRPSADGLADEILIHQLRASADIQSREVSDRLKIPNATTDRAELMRKAADRLAALRTRQPADGPGVNCPDCGHRILTACPDCGAEPLSEAGVKGLAQLTRQPADTVERVAFQARVNDWMMVCFGPEIAADKLERADRFIEEALELCQTWPDFTADRAHALVDYVFNRPVGEPVQEIGGVMVTLAALCNTAEIDIGTAAETELARVWTKVDAIRAKQATKPTGSVLPIAMTEER